MSFDYLKEIVDLVSKKRLDKIELYDKNYISSKDSKFNKLFNALENNIVKSDEEACKHLYGSSKNNSKYRQLKSRFVKRLLNTVHFIDINEVSTKDDKYNKAYFQCYQALTTARYLIKFGARKSATYVIQNHFSVAEKFRFYEILKEYSFILLQSHSLAGSLKDTEKEKIRFIKYAQQADLEIRAKVLLAEMRVNFVKTSKVTVKTLKELAQQLNEISEINKISSSYEVTYAYFSIKLKYLEVTNNLSSLLLTIDEFEKFLLTSKNYSNKTKLSVCILWKLKALLHNKSYKLGEEIIEKNESLFAKNTYNWFVFQELAFKIYLNNKNTYKAKKTYEGVIKSKIYSTVNSELVKEKWKIYEAFLAFYVNEYAPNDSMELNIKKFLNQFTHYYHDKSGFNFNIYIVEMLSYIQANDYDSYSDRIDAIKSYKNRYLKDPSLKRSNIFCNLIIQMEKYDFDYKNVEAIMQSDINYLKSLQDRIQVNEVEVIAYEDIWDLIKKFIDKNNK